MKSLNTSIVSLVDEFAERVFLELNYVQEGINAERFARLYGDNSDVVVPTIDWERTSARVLTMEFIEGTKLSEREKLKEKGLDVLSLVDIGIQCSLRQLLGWVSWTAPKFISYQGRKTRVSRFRDDVRNAGNHEMYHHRSRRALGEQRLRSYGDDYYKLEFLDESVTETIVPGVGQF